MRIDLSRVFVCGVVLLSVGCGDAGSATDATTTMMTMTTVTGATTVMTTDATTVADTSATSETGQPTGSDSEAAPTTSTSGTNTTTSASDATTGDGTTGEPLPPGARGFRFINGCDETVWVGSIGNPIAPKQDCQSDADCSDEQTCNQGNKLCTWKAPLGGGWELAAGAELPVVLPPAWGGRFWPRTGCAGFNEQGMTACQTGDCGGHEKCPAGVGGSPPATLAEFTLIPPDAPIGLDFYDVSNVDGTNIPVRIDARAGSFTPEPPAGAEPLYYCGSPGCTGDCGPLAACPWDLATTCPPELRVLVDNEQVGCRSAGQVCALDPNNPVLQCAQQNDLYGCVEGGQNGVIGSCYSQGAAPTCCGCPSWSPPGACNNGYGKWQLPSLPEKYAKVFKDACPTAYSFPYDDPTSTFTCRGTGEQNVGYDITFCPK